MNNDTKEWKDSDKMTSHWMGKEFLFSLFREFLAFYQIGFSQFMNSHRSAKLSAAYKWRQMRFISRGSVVYFCVIFKDWTLASSYNTETIEYAIHLLFIDTCLQSAIPFSSLFSVTLFNVLKAMRSLFVLLCQCLVVVFCLSMT